MTLLLQWYAQIKLLILHGRGFIRYRTGGGTHSEHWPQPSAHTYSGAMVNISAACWDSECVLKSAGRAAELWNGTVWVFPTAPSKGPSVELSAAEPERTTLIFMCIGLMEQTIGGLIPQLSFNTVSMVAGEMWGPHSGCAHRSSSCLFEREQKKQN